MADKKRVPTRELFDQLDAKLDALEAAKADFDKAATALDKAQSNRNEAGARYETALVDADRAREALNTAVAGQTQTGVVTA